MRNLLLALFLIPTVFSCCLATAGSSEPIPDYTITLDPVPDSRSFYMGLVPHPHDYTLEGVNEAYTIIGNHADMIAHHFDDGVP